jgi:hypothetical protein
MNLMASNALSTLTIGRIGPNTSSCITGSVGFTSTKIVGAINLSEGSVSPPTAILPLFKNATNRLKKKKTSLRQQSAGERDESSKTIPSSA